MANLSVEEPDALVCARPGLWEPWRVTARATRPDVTLAPVLSGLAGGEAEGQERCTRSISVPSLRAHVAAPIAEPPVFLGAAMDPRRTGICVL